MWYKRQEDDCQSRVDVVMCATFSFWLCDVCVHFLMNSAQLNPLKVFVVPGSNCSSTCDGSLQKPFGTIQAALDVSSPDSIANFVLTPGIYTGVGNRALNIDGGFFNISYVCSALLPCFTGSCNRGSNANSTIIYCQGQDYGLTLTSPLTWQPQLTSEQQLPQGSLFSTAFST